MRVTANDSYRRTYNSDSMRRSCRSAGISWKFEDYDIEIMDATGINNLSVGNNFTVSQTSDKIIFTFSAQDEYAKSKLEILDVTEVRVIRDYFTA